jgi:hypothetical protein
MKKKINEKRKEGKQYLERNIGDNNDRQYVGH